MFVWVCFSAPVGNPANPVLLEGNYPTQFSLQAETVLERELKSGSSAKHEFKGTFYTGKVSLYVGNKLDLYGLVGAYDGKVKEFPNSRYIIVTKAEAVIGLGVSYVLYEWEFLGGILRLGADAKYRQFEPEIDTVKDAREKVATTSNALSFKEWQTALGLGYQYKKIAPYFGVKYSDMDAHIKFTQDSTSYSDTTIESSEIWGLFYGIDVLLFDNVSFNVEARHMDETAFNAGLSCRF